MISCQDIQFDYPDLQDKEFQNIFQYIKYIQYTLFWYTLRSALEKKSEFYFKDSQHQQKKCIADFSESMLKRKIWKNVLLISMAFMVLFTSFQSMASLQSSINKARKMSIFAGKCNTFTSICKIHKKGTIKIFQFRSKVWVLIHCPSYMGHWLFPLNLPQVWLSNI